MKKQIWPIIEAVREKKPLIQAITNYVTINDCANILLSFGASPAMCESVEEVEGFVQLANALYINIGTLTSEQKEAIPLAVQKASACGKPVVIDPVGVGAIPSRNGYLLNLLEENQITAVKGNMGEIKVLAGREGKLRGVDSLDDGLGGVEACEMLARKYNTVVIATGAADIITDGKRSVTVKNGTPMLALITGAGCMLGALITATVAVREDPLLAALAAVMAMNLAGEKAAAELGENLYPGSFRMKLIDHIYALTEKDIKERSQIKCL